MLIYKIFTEEQWLALEETGNTAGSPVDLADGYVHFSTSDQLAETRRRHFADMEGLWLLAVEADGLGTDLRWEPARDGALFPHLYRRLRGSDVVWARPMAFEEEERDFGEPL